MKKKSFIEQHDARCYGLSPRQISRNALKVIAKLHDCGQQAYLVGGCVRDLMLQRQPKDFDLATNLHPPQIKKLFNNCRLIGRRFRLAHIRFRNDIIEVATFRAVAKHTKHNKAMMHTGLLLRDNNYGSLQEDILRRDFTVNALYYDPFKHELLAYKNAIQHLHSHNLCMIGDSQVRYREDPVRMLRAVRFSSSLAFTMHDNVAQPLPQLAHLLKQVPPARLLYEFVKLFHGGHAVSVFYALRRHQLFKALFPLTDSNLNDQHLKFLHCLLADTDRRVAHGDLVTLAFTMAGFLCWPTLSYCEQKGWDRRAGSLHRAVDYVLKKQACHLALPIGLADTVRKILVDTLHKSSRDLAEDEKQKPRLSFFLQNPSKRHGRRDSKCSSSDRYARAALHFVHLRTMAEREAKTTPKPAMST